MKMSHTNGKILTLSKNSLHVVSKYIFNISFSFFKKQLGTVNTWGA